MENIRHTPSAAFSTDYQDILSPDSSTPPHSSREKEDLPNIHLRILSDTLNSADMYLTLRIRQAKVCNYQHRNNDLWRCSEQDHLDWEVIAPASDELAHVTSLQIYLKVNDHDHIDRADELLARTPALRNLEIVFGELGIYDDWEDCDGALRVVRKMFRTHIKSGRTTRLRSLRMTSMCLLLVSELLTTVLDLKDLKYLQLFWCTDIDPFLHALETLGLNLSSLCIEYFGQEALTERTINNFVRSLNPLKRLTT